MKKYILIPLLFLAIASSLKAQDYQNAVGLRFGLSNGVTFKHFITTNDAVEGILATRYGGFNLTGLFERHTTAFDTDGLYFYYGGGAHIGSFNNNAWFTDQSNHTIIGIDGILGLEYVIPDFPLNVSLDWKPGLNLIGYAGFWGDELALSVRYMF
ncbi:MAG: hypothetical protein H6540_00370 [Bacteroidales bacterium]|nr:hypothetical protein [Bacteroidales bacterium]